MKLQQSWLAVSTFPIRVKLPLVGSRLRASQIIFLLLGMYADTRTKLYFTDNQNILLKKYIIVVFLERPEFKEH